MSDTFDAFDDTSEGGCGGRRVLRVVLFVAAVLVIVSFSVLFFIVRGVEYSRGSETGEIVFTVVEGEDVRMLAERLRDADIIGSEWSFLYHLSRGDARKRIQAGDYLVSGTLSIPELVERFVSGETFDRGIRITFPEGWTAEQMAERLSENGFDGAAFLALFRDPAPALRTDYAFLGNIPESATLEGVLFPDTYFFDPASGAEDVVRKILDGFEAKAAPVLSGYDGRGWYDALILASILETEVRTEADRRQVADLFLRRLEADMALQSDATVRYALGETKVQHSLDDISIDSPYNSYKYPGLPPGPVSNPGLVSIRAALDPIPNSYWYFLNNPETGETVFSVTFEEHVANKGRNGL